MLLLAAALAYHPFVSGDHEPAPRRRPSIPSPFHGSVGPSNQSIDWGGRWPYQSIQYSPSRLPPFFLLVPAWPAFAGGSTHPQPEPPVAYASWCVLGLGGRHQPAHQTNRFGDGGLCRAAERVRQRQQGRERGRGRGGHLGRARKGVPKPHKRTAIAVRVGGGCASGHPAPCEAWPGVAWAAVFASWGWEG